MTVSFQFHGDLPVLLRDRNNPAAGAAVHYPLTRRTSIKDAVEALGIPHTEVGQLIINGHEKNFDYLLKDDDAILIYPPIAPFDVTRPSILRPSPLPDFRFLVDANVGKLARLLRMAGFDSLFDPQLHDEHLAEIASREQRILLSRDISLLKRRKVIFGRLVREQDPQRQFDEVITLFGIAGMAKPFSRCLVCNNLLKPVEKIAVLDRLELLTRKYFDTFTICPACDRIYWAGSHRDKMVACLESLLEKT